MSDSTALNPLGELHPAGAGYLLPWFYSAALTPNQARREVEDNGYIVKRCAHVRRLNLYRVFVTAGKGVK